MKNVLALVAVAGLAGVASAQSATVAVTANGGANASVAPGAIVSIATTATWGGAVQFAGLAGSINVSGNAGAGANFTSDFSAGTLVNLGAFNGGSRQGIDIAVTPAVFTGGFIVPPSGNTTLNIGSYDLDTTGLAPGIYNVDFNASALAPNVRLFLTTSTPSFVEAQTEYRGATIEIIPAPASLALVGLGGLVAGRRRR
ncbi:MAG: MYXO-CTERM sorting domain-containing protein [Phycisphaerales bacterium]